MWAVLWTIYQADPCNQKFIDEKGYEEILCFIYLSMENLCFDKQKQKSSQW